MTLSEYISLGGLVIAIVTAVGTWISGRRTRKEAEEAGKIAREAQRESHNLAGEAARIQALDWTSQHFRDVRMWGTEVTCSISDLIHLSKIEDFKYRNERWISARSRLSALIDMGRWHFPNEKEESFGVEKPPAYRGSRQRILDWVVWAYESYPQPPSFYDEGQKAADPYTTGAYEKAVNCKREFVSEIQRVLNPRNRELRVNEILEKFRLAELMRDPSDNNRKPLSFDSD